MTAPTLLRPRTAAELVDAAFVLLREHYADVVAAAAVFLIPALVVQLLLPVAAWRAGEALFFIAGAAAEGAVIAVASDAYLGRPVSVRGAVRLAARRWLRLLAALITQLLVTTLGVILFIVPGLIAFARTFAMVPAVVLEGADVGGAFRRADRLAQDAIWRIVGTIGIASLVAALLTLTAGWTAILAARALGIAEWRVQVAAADGCSVLTYPVVYVVSTLLYYDLRIRKEGFDLELLAQSLGPAAAAAGSTAPAAGEG